MEITFSVDYRFHLCQFLIVAGILPEAEILAATNENLNFPSKESVDPQTPPP